jgi:hypothetical protein
MKTQTTQTPVWQRVAVWIGITLGYLGVAVFGVTAMFEFINPSSIILGLLLIGMGVTAANLGRIVIAVQRG